MIVPVHVLNITAVSAQFSIRQVWSNPAELTSPHTHPSLHVCSFVQPQTKSKEKLINIKLYAHKCII